VGGIFLACRHTNTKGPLNAAVAQADKAWQTVEIQWKRLADNKAWLAARRQADDLIQRFQRLGGEEANRITGLKTRQRENQLRLFLEKYPIGPAVIKGIGDSRKTTLRSYGIETAADIERSRIEGISGFGPGIATVLLDWRALIERKFIFDSTQPLDPVDVTAIKNDIARQSADLTTQLRQSLSSLQQSAAGVLGVRASLRTSAVDVWNRRKQCEHDAAAAGGNPPTIHVRRSIFAAIAVVGFLSVHAVNYHATETNRTAPATGVARTTVPTPNKSNTGYAWNTQAHKSNSDSTADAELPFTGKWWSHPDCDGNVPESQLLLITSREAKFPSGSSCFFHPAVPDGAGWKVSGTCSSQRMGTIPGDIKFTVPGQTLTWASGIGTAIYYRCQSPNTAESDRTSFP
jgi:hypothetical protein